MWSVQNKSWKYIKYSNIQTSVIWLWKALFWYLIMEVSETVGDRYGKMHLIDTTIFWLGETVFTASFKSQALNLNPKLMKLCWSHRIKLSKVWARFMLLRFWHNISLSLNIFSSNFWVCWTRTLVWGCPQPGNYFLSNRSMCRLFLWFSMIA